jgi:hypothetical protein
VSSPRAATSVDIAAPIDLVWRVMTDLPRYPEWNPFVVDIKPVAGAFSVGSPIALTVKWGRGGGASTIEVVDRLDAPAAGGDSISRALMEYRFVGWLPRLALVRGSRQQTLEQRPGGPTTYSTSESFRGLLARGVPLAKVQDGFERHARALKARAESLQTARPARQ